MSQVEGSGDAAVDTGMNDGAAVADGQGKETGSGDAELGASFLSKDEEGGEGSKDIPLKETPEGGQDGEKSDEEADPAKVVPKTPEDYALNFAEDITVDKALLQGFKAEAHKLGISRGQAQKLADFYTKSVGDSAKTVNEAHVKAIIEAEKGWVNEIEARPGFKQELVDAKRALKEFGSEGFTEIMNQTRLGSHPVFFDFMAKIGKALAEPEARGRGTGGGDMKPLADRLWPDMK